MSRLDILGVGFDVLSLEEAVDRAMAALKTHEGIYVCTPNPEIVMKARRDPELMAAVNGADMVLPDGVGILWAAKRKGEPLPERVAGYDFLLALLRRMRGSVFILGGQPGVAEKAAETIRRDYPGVTIAGCCDGYIRDELGLIAAIGESRPDLLMVCLGASKQEKWMAVHRELPVGVMIGLGGSVDVLAGTVRRAPLWWRERNVEWLYRMIRQPRRLLRAMHLPRYVLSVLLERKKI